MIFFEVSDYMNIFSFVFVYKLVIHNESLLDKSFKLNYHLNFCNIIIPLNSTTYPKKLKNAIRLQNAF